MKYKKLLIILCSIVGAIILCVILSFTLFRLKTVELNFKNDTTIYASENSKQAVIDSAGFSFKKPIFSINKSKIEKTLEKENSFLKIINIETVFPNKIVVHCAQRELLYCIEDSDMYYYCDEQLKLLEDPISKNSEFVVKPSDNVVLLKNVVVSNKDANKGEFLTLSNSQDIIKNIPLAFAYNNKTISDICAMFTSIELGYGSDYYTRLNEAHLIFETRDGFKIKIGFAKKHLVQKLNLMLSLVPNCVEYYKTHMLIIELNPIDVSAKPHIYAQKLN